MKRDMDLVRSILLEIEAAEKPFAFPQPAEVSDEEVGHHVSLLIGAGFLSAVERVRIHSPSHSTYQETMGFKITWAGYEFLETIRDPVIWEKTKAGARKTGSWAVSLLAELGKAYVTEKARNLGLPV